MYIYQCEELYFKQQKELEAQFIKMQEQIEAVRKYLQLRKEMIAEAKK